MNKLGIDIGYSTFKYVYLDSKNNLIESDYIFHKGNITKYYKELLEKIKASNKEKSIKIGITGSLASRINLSKEYHINNSISLIEGTLLKNKSVKAIIELGAQETKYITDIEHNNMKFFMNTSCAAGTGSFLEEQALRLSIDIKDISAYIDKATEVPRIAGRCSVFSKTDMIHHMQDGVKIEDILQGLCYALVRNYKANVLQKNELKKPVMLSGGVINNKGVVKALKDILKLKEEDIVINENFELLTCFGACKIAEEKGLIIDVNKLESLGEAIIEKPKNNVYEQLNKFGMDDSLDKHNCISTNTKEGYLGVDIGSTSINFVVIDEDKNVIDYIYTKTNGKPKEVVYEYLEKLKERLGKEFKFKGIGTTGSGREYIGKLINADLIVNEITAQAEGAVNVCSDVDTIFEIGGQDSKYICIENKLVKDFEMNKICAAGTGAFIEEQIKKLGISLEEFGKIALKGDDPCNLGDRCTVFIEGNIGKAIGEGESIENISAGLAYSIVKNYLNRVVGARPIGNKIFLQGGIAHNQAVVNAFRALLKKEIMVPEFFSVTGALGTAVLTKESMRNKDKINKQAEFISYLDENEKYFLDGYVNNKELTKKTIGIPRVLFLNKMFPMFNEIFKKLGYNVLISDATNEDIIALSQEYSFEETCFPVKLINGHVAWLLERKVDYIFLPHLYTMKHAGSKVREDYACVYIQTSPKIIESVFNLEARNIKLISPVLSFNFGKQYMIKTLLGIGKVLGKNKIETTAAVMSGMKKFMNYEKKMEAIGNKVLKDIDKDEKVFVIVSRVYNIVDPALNMGIEKELIKRGYRVLHLSHLEASEMNIGEEYSNMYWPFGQHIIMGAKIIKNHKNLYPIYITNHGCGPDTILMHYFKKEMENKPYLHIEVDEHSSKVGVITRVEAFINSLKNCENNDSLEAENIIKAQNKRQTKNKIDFEEEILIPYMYPFSNILKAFLERKNKKVTILEPVSEKTIELGKNFSRGKEYFSLTGMLAEVTNKIKNDEKEYTLYFPTTEGSETFGQYGKLIQYKALECGKNLKLEAPFIEDYLGNKDFGLEFFKALVIGDLINLSSENKRELCLKDLIETIKNNEISNEYFDKTLKNIRNYISKKEGLKKLLIIGEAIVVNKDYLNSNMIKSLQNDYEVIKQPLSEELYMLFSDFCNKRNKVNKPLIRILNEAKTIIEKVNLSLEIRSPFNRNSESLNEVLIDKLPQYAGGSGRYRLAKLVTAENVDGIIIVSSMYENTATILKILREKYKELLNIPILDLYFDSNISKNNEELIETFIAYL
ncbi:putative CoA-substrate-specific enzyme activase [Clostridium saccharoperbutylacetonicum]|uniref:Putative CoA-substrate-specific enzyme activase n=1 Tax=Clostridium saccharoperbutylacetonicum N1-4(HMT) TaxID=931276 RepID=M1N534_9CLOT|nr:acyl-CoA dehydratase activase [Clostridium saccharoperbutylacetonicum]AGF58557.1 putative CoA-substrate-specific enzyme activase [Clostridium saccharoperbutylacetonicum N1-4(HMT)]NRT60665.1 putative CoA-substrate-specific enzyme activase [Clostridium saccharoperbutylacetonicum]NSB23979.1 putative CoA-substrate-specific enzyme activase [Clostridium saccharoperbutylacetonicum]NSB43355.1 putative CoA-substrate-specific enzyme activase [Clostridium saccharoperbutylacetonicum]